MIKRLVIGLHGQQGSGKDTAADLLVEKFGFIKLAFAEELKREIHAAFPELPLTAFTDRDEKTADTKTLRLTKCRNTEFIKAIWNLYPDDTMFFTTARSPRWIAQHWGTEYRRKQDSNYWLKALGVKIQALPVNTPVVISDVRFVNEAVFLHQAYDAEIWHIMRPENPHAVVHTNHTSEIALPEDYITRQFNNNGTLLQFHSMITVATGQVFSENE